MRYKLIFRQLESGTHLYASLQEIEEERSSCLTKFLSGAKESEIDSGVANINLSLDRYPTLRPTFAKDKPQVLS
jgi:hypothetical protein